MIDVHLLLGRLAHHVEAAQPGLGLFQVCDAGGDDQHGLQPPVGYEPHHAFAGTVLIVGEHRVELLGDGFGIAGLDREQAERHAFHPVDVEHSHGIHDRVNVAASAGDHDQVARRVHSDDRALRRNRLDDPLHLRCRYIPERDHMRTHSGAAPSPTSTNPQRRAGPCFGGCHDTIDALVDDNGRAFASQHHLEHLEQRLARNGRGRLQRDRPLELLAHHVVDAEGVAEHQPRRFGDARPGQVDDDTVLAAGGERAGFRTSDQLAVAGGGAVARHFTRGSRKRRSSATVGLGNLARTGLGRNGSRQRQLLPRLSTTRHRAASENKRSAPHAGDPHGFLSASAVEIRRRRFPPSAIRGGKVTDSVR